MKAVRVFIIVSILLMVYGCGKRNIVTPQNGSNDTTVKTPSVTQTDTKDNSTTKGPEEVVKEGTITKDGNVILKQLAFLYQKNTIALSDKVDDKKMESLLGKPVKISSHTYSKDDGLNMDQLNGMTEKKYQYPGLTIKTLALAENKKAPIVNIEITNSNYPTVRNIKVGDSFDKLKEAYPEGYLIGGELTDEEDDYRYEPVNYVDVLSFHIKDKKIESILIYSMVD